MARAATRSVLTSTSAVPVREYWADRSHPDAGGVADTHPDLGGSLQKTT